MTDHSPGLPSATMLKALNWAYERALSSIPTLGSAESLAKSHLARRPGAPEKAIDDLIKWRVDMPAQPGSCPTSAASSHCRSPCRPTWRPFS